MSDDARGHPHGAPSRERRVAFVTGASRGIGRATALALAEKGFDLVLAARTLREADPRGEGATAAGGRPLPGSLERTAAEVRARGREALVRPIDLLDRVSLDAAVGAAIAAWGRIDVLVNNAIYQGPGLMDDFLDGALEDLERVFQGNVIAQVHLARRVLRPMLATGGGIVVNLTSAAGMMDPPLRLARGGWSFAHGATKAALHRMAGILQLEFGDRGIRAYNLEPGLVRSESLVAAMGEESEIEKLGVPSAPVEVPAAVIAWLCTDPEAVAMGGQTVHAQPFCARRGLLPGWPPRRAGPSRPRVGVEEHKRTFAAYFEALGRADRAAMRALVTDDLVWVVPPSAPAPFGGVHRGADAVIDRMLGAVSGVFLPGSQRTEVRVAVGEGDVLIAEARIRARTPHAEYENWYCFVVEFRGGRIAEIREHVDTITAARFFAPAAV